MTRAFPGAFRELAVRANRLMQHFGTNPTGLRLALSPEHAGLRKVLEAGCKANDGHACTELSHRLSFDSTASVDPKRISDLASKGKRLDIENCAKGFVDACARARYATP